MTDVSKYLDKTMTQLLEIVWTKDNIPTEDDSNVVRRHYSVTLKKLKDFSNEDVRFCLSQEIGLTYVVPLAIEILREDILAEGHMYPGDIVSNLLNVDAEYWDLHVNHALEVQGILSRALEKCAMDQEFDGQIGKGFNRKFDKFLARF